VNPRLDSIGTAAGSLLWILLAGGLFAAASQGAVIRVNTANDEQTAGNRVCSLREAIRNANSAIGDLSGGDCATGEVAAVDTVVFDVVGTIALSIIETPLENFLPPIAAAATAGALVLQGPGADRLIIDGGINPPELRLLDVAAGAILTVSGLTLAGGGGTGFADNGAGLRARDADVSVLGVWFDRNLTHGNGGGISVEGGSVEIVDSRLNANAAVGFGFGGAAFVDGGAVHLRDTTISSNWSGVFGGGGGGLWVGSGFVTLLRCTVAGNLAGFVRGGGGLGSNGGAIAIDDSTISGNEVFGVPGFGGPGGGVVLSGGGHAIRNSTISGNMTFGSGGGLEVHGAVRLVNLTVVGNQAASGGGIVGEGVELHNSLVSGNTLLDGVTASDCLAPTTPWLADDGNLFGSSGNVSGCPIGNPSDVYPTVPLTQILNPVLADNGGPTRTHALAPNGPAVDTANPSVCAAGPPGGVGGVDQRGRPRPAQSCDVGALELSLVETPTLSPLGLATLGALAIGLALRRLAVRRGEGTGASIQ